MRVYVYVCVCMCVCVCRCVLFRHSYMYAFGLDIACAGVSALVHVLAALVVYLHTWYVVRYITVTFT